MRYICRFNGVSEIKSLSFKKGTFLSRWWAACRKSVGRWLSHGPSAAGIANLLGAALVPETLLYLFVRHWLVAALFMTPMAKHPWAIDRLCGTIGGIVFLTFLLCYWATFGACVAAVASFVTGSRQPRRLPLVGFFGFLFGTWMFFFILVKVR
jgi:hypothetical protein